jgi:hypothetical protein
MIDHRTRSGKFLRLPAELKEKLRLEFEEIRNKYETANLGSFEQIYPCQDQSKMELYKVMLEA